MFPSNLFNKISFMLFAFLCLLAKAHAEPAAASSPAPKELHLIWNQSPSPHTEYTLCGSAKKDSDFCVPEGVWLGVCRSVQFGKADVSLQPGRITIDKTGAVTFSACPDYSALVYSRTAEDRGFTSKKARFSHEGCGDRESGTVSIDRAIHHAEIDRIHRILKVRTKILSPKEKIPEDMCEYGKKLMDARSAAFAPGLGEEVHVDEKDWSIYDIMDLNGDGIPEIIVATNLKDFPYAQVGVLLSLNEKGVIDIIAKTITRSDLFLNSAERKMVNRVQQAQELCEYWGGEEASDKARAAEIAQGARRDCAEFDRLLARARKLYPKSADLIKLSGSK